MICDRCKKTILTEYEQGLKAGRNIGLFAGFFMGALIIAFAMLILSWVMK